MLILLYVQVYIVYMGHRGESSELLEATDGLSVAEAAHHALLNQVLDAGSVS